MRIERTKKIKEILFPKKVAPIRLFGFRLFHMEDAQGGLWTYSNSKF